MRVKLAVIICVAMVLFGCEGKGDALSKALTLRSKILASEACSFQADVTADFDEKTYTFSMNCTANEEGCVTFEVKSPTTIAGISGTVSGAGGEITFDDQVLAFATMADGELAPVSAPWIFMKALRSGYINGCADEEQGYLLSIDDSYEEDALRLNILIDENLLPVSGEIFWQGRRVLTLSVEEFIYL